MTLKSVLKATMNAHSLAALVAAADKINNFASPFTLAGSRRGSENLALATVWAAVADDNGGPLSPTDIPVGETRLVVDIEFFNENGRTYTDAGRAELAAAEKAENEILEFCEGLGFKVEFESHTGGGRYGPSNSLFLS